MRFDVKEIPLARLEPAEWNANRVPDDVLAKIRRSIERFGIVENLVVRPDPETEGSYEVISGNHRLLLYRELELETAPCHVVSLDDARARLLAQTLNRTRGSDDPEAYARLVERVLSKLSLEEVLGLRVTKPYVYVEPDVFCERLMPSALELLDRILAATDVERLPNVQLPSLLHGPPDEFPFRAEIRRRLRLLGGVGK